jgi:hypothetical protein
MITSVNQIYATWQEDSLVVKGNKRQCDLNWAKLAWYVRHTTYPEVEQRYGQERLGQWAKRIRYKYDGETAKGEEEPAILNMSMIHATSALFAMEWYIFSDLYAVDKGSMEWVQAVKHIVNLIRHRLYYLATETLSVNILNVDEYTMTEVECMKYNIGTTGVSDDGQPVRRGGVLTQQDYYTNDYMDDSERRAKEKALQADHAKAKAAKEEEAAKRELAKQFDQMMANLAGVAIEETSRTTQVNQSFLFDMNETLRSIDIGLEQYQQECMSIPKAPRDRYDFDAVAKFRQVVLERFKTMNSLLMLRKTWHCLMTCLESYDRLRKRKKSMAMDVQLSVLEVVGSKMGGDLILPVSSEEFMLARPEFNRDQWIRVNTDALFAIYCGQLQTGDLFTFLYRGQEEALLLDHEKQPYIFRIRVTNLWCLMDVDGTKETYLSFTEAFVGLRLKMLLQLRDSKVRVAYNVTEDRPKKIFEEFDLSQLDDIFGLVNNNASSSS